MRASSSWLPRATWIIVLCGCGPACARASRSTAEPVRRRRASGAAGATLIPNYGLIRQLDTRLLTQHWEAADADPLVGQDDDRPGL